VPVCTGDQSSTGRTSSQCTRLLNRLNRSRNVSGANAIQVLTVAGMFRVFFFGVLYLQRVLGYDSLETGLAFLPVTVVLGRCRCAAPSG
jgi:hypothetical protein